MFEKKHRNARNKSWRSYKKKPANLKLAAQNLFEKKFQYQANDAKWALPAPPLFTEFYHFEELQQLKQRLNQTKVKLNDYELLGWSSHTRRMEPSSGVPWHLKSEIKAEFVTVAWCKFFECLHRFPLVKGPQLNSLHLCEAPGAFIAALNHYLRSKYKDDVEWKWLSTTLNPYNETNPLNKMISDDRFILNTLEHWVFYNDFTGNIISRRNIEDLREACAERLDNQVHLITADGSIDCVERPDCQEDTVATLHFAEITAALSILADGGCFVLKMFTLFEASSVSKMFLLNCVFEQVHVFKPATSKRGNSEVYIICLGYKQHTPHLPQTLDLMKSKLQQGVWPLFAKAQLPKDFLQQHENCTRRFMSLQIEAIESNIYTYERGAPQTAQRAHQLRGEVWTFFHQLYRVEAIPPDLMIITDRQVVIEKNRSVNIYKGSHSEREVFRNTSLEQKIFALRSNLNELEKSLDAPRTDMLYEEAQPPPPDTNADVADLHVYRGAQIGKVHSSLFIAQTILLMRNQVESVFEIDVAWGSSKPSCCLSLSDGQELRLEYDTTADGDFAQAQQSFFVRLLTACIDEEAQGMCFHDFPFLTHYSVSLLRYLSLHAFTQLRISAEPAFVVSLSAEGDAHHRRVVLSGLRDLLQSESSICCILELRRLHSNAFSRALVDYNNLLLLQNLRQLLDNEVHL